MLSVHQRTDGTGPFPARCYVPAGPSRCPVFPHLRPGPAVNLGPGQVSCGGGAAPQEGYVLRARGETLASRRCPWHCQVNEKSLPDAFPVRKAEGVGIAKIQGLVQAQNLLWSSLYCTDMQFFALT